MGKWYRDFYICSIDELSDRKIKMIDEFAQKVCNETYDRFSYNYESRIEKIRIGKISEEMFAIFMKEEYGIDLEINYEIYEGVENTDEEDFIINDCTIDIKSSKDTQNVGLIKCFEKFNFPVPADQEIKDLTILIIYSYDLKYYCLCRAIFKEDYKKLQHFGYLDVGNKTYKKFRLCKLRNGITIKQAIDLIISNK